MKIKKIDIKEFQELGFLQEANRLFFHLYGLALCVVIFANRFDGFWHHVKKAFSCLSGKTLWELDSVWDGREDPEGWEFGFRKKELRDEQEIEIVRARAEFVKSELEKRRQAREALFGNVVEPIPEKT